MFPHGPVGEIACHPLKLGSYFLCDIMQIFSDFLLKSWWASFPLYLVQILHWYLYSSFPLGQKPMEAAAELLRGDISTNLMWQLTAWLQEIIVAHSRGLLTSEETDPSILFPSGHLSACKTVHIDLALPLILGRLLPFCENSVSISELLCRKGSWASRLEQGGVDKQMRGW